MDIATIIESGGVVALAIVVWFELRGFRKDLVTVMKDINGSQQKVSEQQAVILERQAQNHDELVTHGCGPSSARTVASRR